MATFKEVKDNAYKSKSLREHAETLEAGTFADIKRPRDGGKGLAGVVTKNDNYFNPFIDLMKGGVQ